MATVQRPSMMKIQRQPSRPAMPSMLAMANANKPEKAPAMEAALKKRACRHKASSLLYQVVM